MNQQQQPLFQKIEDGGDCSRSWRRTVLLANVISNLDLGWWHDAS
ncbi:hypothetical protein LINPERHAP1_LOCUS19070 [Linum perenne]